MDIWILGAFRVCSIFDDFIFLPETLRYLVGNCSCYKDNSIIVKPHLRQKKIVEGYPVPQNQVSKIIGS